MFGKPGLHAARGIQPKRGAAGEGDRVDRLDRGCKSKEAFLAGAGAAAAHVDRGNRRAIENDRRDAGRYGCVISVADADAGNIGEEVFHGLALPAKGQSDHPRKFGLAIRFGKQQHAGVEPSMMDDGVLGIS